MRILLFLIAGFGFLLAEAKGNHGRRRTSPDPHKPELTNEIDLDEKPHLSKPHHPREKPHFGHWGEHWGSLDVEKAPHRKHHRLHHRDAQGLHLQDLSYQPKEETELLNRMLGDQPAASDQPAREKVEKKRKNKNKNKKKKKKDDKRNKSKKRDKKKKSKKESKKFDSKKE
ncbi:unnamed protein product [Darwinula stevensoni]|uniref:Uncharacterized protein n=1 Tax=Darwinula stevensoni TaxID=69355 RepID=A0A7R8X5F9_9CRUS|nr:unnamed protein product [Darwinula stevensoni]CAG0884621.1 unnamed protein product [Darwinula stevensoni]